MAFFLAMHMWRVSSVYASGSVGVFRQQKSGLRAVAKGGKMRAVIPALNAMAAISSHL